MRCISSLRSSRIEWTCRSAESSSLPSRDRSRRRRRRSVPSAFEHWTISPAGVVVAIGGELGLDGGAHDRLGVRILFRLLRLCEQTSGEKRQQQWCSEASTDLITLMTSFLCVGCEPVGDRQQG